MMRPGLWTAYEEIGYTIMVLSKKAWQDIAKLAEMEERCNFIHVEETNVTNVLKVTFKMGSGHPAKGSSRPDKVFLYNHITGARMDT